LPKAAQDADGVGFLRRDARTLSVLWEDGHRDDFDVRDLRLVCPCALCVQKMSGRPLPDPKSVLPDVAPRTISSRGNYTTGHASGTSPFYTQANK
jgi:ATP-binding protein involved in chromosome partitioning